MSNIKNNKIEHLWTILAGSSSVDNETNSFSIFNILEEVTIQANGQNMDPNEKKNISIPFEIISMWKREDIENKEEITSEVKVSLFDPKGIVVQEMGYKMEMKSQHQRMRMRVKANAITVTKQGEYYFSVKIKDGSLLKEVAKIPLIVKMSTPIDFNLLKK